jgi:hypothetical protein
MVVIVLGGSVRDCGILFSALKKSQHIRHVTVVLANL